jgi:uncharacterized membrane protein
LGKEIEKKLERSKNLGLKNWWNTRNAIAFMVIFHLVGLIGLSLEWSRGLFLNLVPSHLLLMSFLILVFHKDWSPKFIGVLIFTYLSGFFAEFFGVETGLVFGEYNYGETLGWKWMEIPFMIGVNWIIMIYSSVMVANKLSDKKWVRIISAALLMVFADVFIEPVAIANDYWSWAGGEIPIQNYLGWFVISFAIITVWYSFLKLKTNKVAYSLYWIQLVFFILLNLFS